MESITILMDAVSLSNITLGSEVLESLPSSPDVHKHDNEGIEMPLRDPRKKDTVNPTIETERGHKYLRHKDKGYRGMPAEQWMKKDSELPATDRVMMDIVQATAKLTALEKRRMFHIDPGMQLDERDKATDVCETPDRDKEHT
jgi:hypothetical protein